MEAEEIKTLGFGKSIEFNLMVRNKANINVKSITDDPQKLILESKLPTIT